MENQAITAKIESWNKWLKALLFFFTRGLFSVIFRIIRYTETKNVVTLVVSIISLVTGLCLILCLIDTVTEITSNKTSILAD